MLLNLTTLKDHPGGRIPFQVVLDLHDLAFGGCCPATEPVAAVGEVRNTAGVYVLSGKLNTTLHGPCDRCTRDVVKPVEFPLHAILAEELANDDGDEDAWTFLLEEGCADLDDIVTTTFVLSMDSKFLCKEDCKGLCCQCGKDLNDGPCGCQPEIDPRLAVLRQLLEK
ncbi:MAG: DUF177 domain-containing protein [Oscillospiraceae bacterium]|nr:DUF177 domain-containing protein [Oscillospiraceae bacterium]